jgi:hypothetical protein
MSIQCIPNFIGSKDAKTFSKKYIADIIIETEPIIFGPTNLDLLFGLTNLGLLNYVNDDIYLSYVNVNEIITVNNNISIIGLNYINVIPVVYSDSDYLLIYVHPIYRYRVKLKDIIGSDYNYILEYYIIYDRKMNAFYYTSVNRQTYFFL